jgi:hypothetical protein
MLRAAKISSAIRRMKLEELLAKLQQIEQQAALTVSEYPHGLTVERQRLIIGLAKQMQAHLRDQVRHGERGGPAQNDPAETETEAGHLREVPVVRAAG